MHHYTKAIVRTPCKNMVHGITQAGSGTPDYELALRQHRNYIDALTECGLEVRILPPDETFPDSVFVEDVAVLTPSCAIITRPAPLSRQGETTIIRNVLLSYYPAVEQITQPGTIEGGDVMKVGSHFYIGLSERTNAEGAAQFIRILKKYGMTGSTVNFRQFLHLKTGVSFPGGNHLLAAGEFINHPTFSAFNILIIPEEESYAANCIRVNDFIILPEGYRMVKKMLESAGYRVKTVDVSEFRKLDGGVSCLSLRF